MTFQSTGHVMAVDPAIQQSNAMIRLADNIIILLGVLNRSHVEKIEPLLRDMRDTMKRIEQLHIEQNGKLNNRARYIPSRYSPELKRLLKYDWNTIAAYIDANTSWPTNEIYDVINDIYEQIHYDTSS